MIRWPALVLFVLAMGAAFGACGPCRQAMRAQKEREADDQACTRGDTQACLRAGDTWLSYRGTDTAASASYLENAITAYAGACGGNLADGCLQLAELYRKEPTLTRERARVTEYGIRACDLGAALGCLQATTVMAEDDTRRTPLLTRACDLDVALCIVSATGLSKTEPGLAQKLATRACDAARWDDCGDAAELWVHRPVRDGFARRACEGGNDEQCVRLATRFEQASDPEAARELYRVGCRRRHEPSCAELGRMLAAEASPPTP